MSFFWKNDCQKCKECATFVIQETGLWHGESIEDLIKGVVTLFTTDIIECQDKCKKCQRNGKTEEDRKIGYYIWNDLETLKLKNLKLSEDIEAFEKNRELWENPLDPELVEILSKRFTREAEEAGELQKKMDETEAAIRTAEAVNNIELKEKQEATLRHLAELQFEEDMRKAGSPHKGGEKGKLLHPRIYHVLSNWNELDNPHGELNQAYYDVTGREMDPRVGSILLQKYVRKWNFS